MISHPNITWTHAMFAILMGGSYGRTGCVVSHLSKKVVDLAEVSE